MRFLQWYWGGRRYILNQIYPTILVLAIAEFRDQPVFCSVAIFASVGLMIWRFKVWDRHAGGTQSTGSRFSEGDPP